jgi:rhodanese-related sulfurtransferase
VPHSPVPTASAPDLSARDLRQRLDRGESLTLLDVREPSERSICSITVPQQAGELHIPMREIPERFVDIQAVLARGPLVVYCHHGTRSRDVAQWLAERGLNGILNLRGGIDAWSLEADASVPRYRR